MYSRNDGFLLTDTLISLFCTITVLSIAYLISVISFREAEVLDKKRSDLQERVEEVFRTIIPCSCEEEIVDE